MKNKPIIITGVIALLLLVIGAIIYVAKEKASASSIAIIGGADGPTAVYFEWGIRFIPITLIALVIITLGIIYLVKRK